ncbi:MAG: ABC transporter ATP-binding protein [Lentisphaerae bacterium]|nr:ABC transporter ATP-binding protein [Lentisphaerota bacterium]
MAAFLELRGVTKKFGDFTALNDVSLEIRRGEIFSLLGPSGCGKTTLLRVCAGFEQPDAGRVILDGHDITDLPPNRRRLNTIFQSYALFPHLTVRENIAFGLRVARRPAAEIKREVGQTLALMQLEEHADKRPALLSGGQKQRVAVARALINKPEILLLDEPLAALDLKLRQRMLVELDNIHDEVGITFIFVTHDQGEAMSISDRIAVMHEGRVEQIGTAAEIYEAPRTSFVAAFIGDTNFFDGQVLGPDTNPDYCQLAIEGFTDIISFNDKRLPTGQLAHLSIRPEKFRISRNPPPPDPFLNRISGTVEEIIYQGTHTNFWVRAGEYRVAVRQPHSRFKLDQEIITWKDAVWLSWHADDGCMLEQYRADDESLLSLPDPDDAHPAPGGTTGTTPPAASGRQRGIAT